MQGSQEREPVHPDEFRRLMAHFPTGVVAVTAARRRRPVGIVMSSFFSVSLEPCLIGFCVARTSTTWPLIHDEDGRFSVNLLAADQAPVSAALSARGPDKFRTLEWYPSDGGSPVLRGALAYFDCAVAASHDAGDHAVVIGEVHRFRQLRTTSPLVFYRREYRSVAEPVPVAGRA